MDSFEILLSFYWLFKTWLSPAKAVCFFQGASLSEIKKQYRVLSLKFHPDKGGDEATFMRIAKAYAAYVLFRPNHTFLISEPSITESI